MKHSFILDGAKILGEYWDGNALIPLYDNEENICGILYGDIPYYFLKNLQGDVIAIVDESGTTVARYTYDAWGACTISYDATATPAFEGAEPVNIATVNPFRYRTYYFDTETGLYYLRSRYYDPSIGRFINADEIGIASYLAEVMLDLNMFSYVRNSTLQYSDHHGYTAATLYASSAIMRTMGALTVSSTTLLAAIKSFIAVIWNIFLVVCVLLVVIAAVIVICKTVSAIYNAVENAVRAGEKAYKNYKGKICVYVLARKPKKISSVFYVGRTKNIIARYNQHRRTKGIFHMYVVFACKTKEISRIAEQSVLGACLAGNFTSIVFGQKPSNQIRGIAKSKASAAVNDLRDDLDETLSLLSCTSESDLLYYLNL